MSFDLVAFDPTVPPKDYDGFIEWYEDVSDAEDEAYFNQLGNPSLDVPSFGLDSLSESMQNWYREMIVHYPDYADTSDDNSDERDERPNAEYGFGDAHIYVGFGWSQADAAYKTMFELAKKHNVGFFGVSHKSEVWGPTDGGDYALYR